MNRICLCAVLSAAALASPVLAEVCIEPVGSCDTPVFANAVTVSGSYAFVVDLDHGMRVIDVSNPASPVEVGAFLVPFQFTSDVAVSGSYAYVTDVGGLRVVDISNPASPTGVGFLNTSSARGVSLSGGLAYVADNDAGLVVVDITTPDNPIQLGVCDTPGFAWSVAANGGYAYVADYLEGLRVIDVSDPATPTEVGYYETPEAAHAVAVSASGYVSVADGWGGLRIINVSNPLLPTEYGFCDTVYFAYDAALSTGHAWVADHDGLSAIDTSDLSAPIEVASYFTPGDTRGVALSGNYAYVADGFEGLQVLHISDCSFFVDGFESGDTSWWSAVLP